MNTDASQAYAIFWTTYAVSFLVFFILISRPMRSWPHWLTTLIQSVLIVALLTPVESTEAVNWWMPAWLHAGYESVLGNTGEANRAFYNLALAGGGMLVVWLLELLRARLWPGKKRSKGGNKHKRSEQQEKGDADD